MRLYAPVYSIFHEAEEDMEQIQFAQCTLGNHNTYSRNRDRKLNVCCGVNVRVTSLRAVLCALLLTTRIHACCESFGSDVL